MILDTIVSSPIIFPKIVPNDWDKWWNLWISEAKPAFRVKQTHNSKGGPWIGMNVYVKPGVDNIEYTGYNIKNVFCPELFPSLFDNLDLFPIDIAVMQIVSSRCPSPPHSDHTEPRISVRSMLYDNNFTPTFYYQIDGDKKYQTLPDDTNTWMYHDNKYKHGSDYYQGHSKHLIIYHGKIKRELLESNLSSCNDRYKDYIIRDINAVSPNT
jgi:hypothetical protein